MYIVSCAMFIQGSSFINSILLTKASYIVVPTQVDKNAR